MLDVSWLARLGMAIGGAWAAWKGNWLPFGEDCAAVERLLEDGTTRGSADASHSAGRVEPAVRAPAASAVDGATAPGAERAVPAPRVRPVALPDSTRVGVR